MNKNNLLKIIAQKGYDVGLGTKKHFATYDIIEKTPGWIGFVSMSVGILGLVFDELSTKTVSAIFLIVGIVSLYISFYDSRKISYEESGVELTKLFNKLKALYYDVKSLPETNDVTAHIETLQEIESKYYNNSISKQILFSNWYAHYKFFWEHQIDWIDEQLNFKFFRDKVPLSFILFIVLLIVCICTWLYLFNFTECL